MRRRVAVMTVPQTTQVTFTLLRNAANSRPIRERSSFDSIGTPEFWLTVVIITL
jgi:hypothetical protein